MKSGFVWGVVATLAMSTLMVVGMVTGAAPMPRPIPEAIVSLVIGDVATPIRMLVAVSAHLLYGGVFGALLAGTVQRMSVWKGLAFGVVLWIGMGVVPLPLLGWGVFGTAITPKIAVATLVLHLIYGGVLGWTLHRTSDTVAPTNVNMAG